MNIYETQMCKYSKKLSLACKITYSTENPQKRWKRMLLKASKKVVTWRKTNVFVLKSRCLPETPQASLVCEIKRRWLCRKWTVVTLEGLYK